MHDLHRLGVHVLSWAALAGSLLFPSVPHAGDPAATLPIVDASAFAKLRSDYSSRAEYDAFYIGDEKRRALTEAIKAKNAEQVVALGRPWLERCPVDAEAHFHVAMAMSALGRHREAFSHLYSFHGLVQSILESGPGTSKQNAFKVISVSEEYDVLRVLRAELVNQSLDAPYDVMRVKIGSEETTLYFDVSTSLEAQRRQLDGAVKGRSQ